MSELEIYKGMVKKMKDGEIKEMTKTVYDLLLKLEQCDDFHNRCDYLMEHDEITYLLEYITDLRKRIEKLNEDKRGILLELYKANDKRDKLQEENEMLKQADKNTYETSQEIMAELTRENERLKHEVAKLHIIQEEYGNYIENTHIIDDYQKTYFMTNKYLIELKNGKFVYIDELNDKYEDYKSRCEKAVEKIKKIQQNAIKYGVEHDVIICQELIDGLNGRSDE